MNEDLKSAQWFKSSRSNGQNNCVEVAFLPGGHVGLRDSKDKGRGHTHIFTREEWGTFIGLVRDGRFDRG